MTGVSSCYGRILIAGTRPGACVADGTTSFQRSRDISIFDCPLFPPPPRERLREDAQALAAKHGAAIKHPAGAHIGKEDVVAKALAVRGDVPGPAPWETQSYDAEYP